MQLEGKILQRAELYYVENGLARHVENWEDWKRLCIEKYGRVLKYHERVFKEGKDFPPYGRKIKRWPEKMPEYKIGAERVMFCVGPDMDFGRIRDLGITVIQSYEACYHIEHYLNEAERHGLKVLNSVVQLQQEIVDTGNWNRDNMQAQIEACRGHKGFYGYHVFEELNIADKKVNHIIQRQVYDFFKERDPGHPVTQTLSGLVKASNGGLDWDYVNFDALDIIIPDLYVFDGTGEIWGYKPLDGLGLGASQERRYLDDNDIRKPMIFVFQVCDEPAVNHRPPIMNSRVPSGQIENQFRIIEPYGLFTGGVGCGWAWDHGYRGPFSSNEIYDETKNLLDKIKES